MDMSLAWAASRRKLQDEGFSACQRVRILAVAHFADGEASRERIRALFHSPLGIYVSQAQREGCDLQLEFDTASEDLAFTLRTLKRVLPEARVEGISPRVFAHRLPARDAG
ncbi:hypothetical protein BSFA1_33530 [Burkholderia sp. SFA1]|uniref:hypothetical protein n=1 Tax=unclassified Caballeronia TaxID=2646786 RepID=UPI001F3B2371|nr:MULTISPECIES: hypothetical protein [unclassified Caballeronia]MCE4544963.1 hypothetical protein [Caballeronia sp. PC1]MCE4570387.1 hypothetical protein [Caballeronia sp. CLC5]BBP98224.1 hypothetical protein BSFA1_33530 [Burkholderia sp. SFA1]